MEFSIDDPEKDKKIIIHNFMKELCRRDDEDNRGLSIDRNRNRNVFSVEEIRQRDLGAFQDIEYIKRVLRGHILENKDNEPEFLDNELNVRLTNAGRARCHEYGL